MASSVIETQSGVGHVRDVVLAITSDSNGAVADYVLTTLAKFALPGARVLEFWAQSGVRTSPSASVSPSVSPSVSASASTSASPSPTPSQSPSASTSPSSSLSPSSSTSISPSASRSPSVSASSSSSPSLSPSTSLSPSVSISPSGSVSPSASFPNENYSVQLFDEHRIDLLQGAAMNVDRVRGANGAIVYAAAPAVHPTVTGSTVLTLHVSNL